MFSLNMVDYPMFFLLLSTWICAEQVDFSDSSEAKFLFSFLDLTGTLTGTWPGACQLCFKNLTSVRHVAHFVSNMYSTMHFKIRGKRIELS